MFFLLEIYSILPVCFVCSCKFCCFYGLVMACDVLCFPVEVVIWCHLYLCCTTLVGLLLYTVVFSLQVLLKWLWTD